MRLFNDPRAAELLLARVGVPYWWGRGDLRTPFLDRVGSDCSGEIQIVWRHFGLVRRDAWTDMSATGLANVCDPVVGASQFGDLFLYGPGSGPKPITHVMLCVGDEVVFGNSGSGAGTYGTMPSAHTRLIWSKYRGDLVVVGRLKVEHRGPGWEDPTWRTAA